MGRKKYLDRHDILLVSGMFVLIILIQLKGVSWFVETFASFYVAITVFNWIARKIKGKKR